MVINRILTDTDRGIYAPVIDMFQKYIPMTGHKIQDAIVQQAFVYQTAKELSPINPRILSAGSYQDIAAELLRYDGYAVYDVDPVMNYDLHTFRKLVNPPSRLYDTIISTSVLEHTTDDSEFVDDICALLKPSGYGILTMDYKNDYVPGDPVPYTSNRFYTMFDLTERLNSILTDNDCRLLLYDYSGHDRFIWDNIQYSFSTFVFKKDTNA